MSADVIDFYTRQKIPAPEDIARTYGEALEAMEAQANAIFDSALSGVWPDFSQAANYHAPDKDAS